MNLSEVFIKRPVATTLIVLAIVIFGVMGYRQLPVSDLPAIDFPTIQVQASLPGASPETMATAVATPLEKAFSAIAGVDSISSVNSQGSTNITLQFNLDRNIDAAAQDVQSMIARAQRQLPSDMPTPPSLQKQNPADQAVVFLTLTTSTLPLSQLNEYAETVIAQRLSTVPGVGQVNLNGAQKFAVRIDLDPRELASRQIGIDQVAQAVQQANSNRATGTLAGSDQSFVVEAHGRLMSAKDYKPVVVAYKNGSPVRLYELANVFDGVENDKTAAWYQGTRTIFVSIQRQPGSNVVELVDRVKELLPQLQAQMPASIKIGIRNDRSQPIRESVADVKFTLMLTMGLVVMVIFIFLRNFSATIIPSLALPVSVLGTFAVMYAFGYSVDNLSMMALTLAVGFVVDDAIVMLENIVRHMEMGKPPLQAAFAGSREVAFTILSMTVSLAAVFIPVLFMGGIVGRLMHEFAVTITAAILVSGVVSISLTPMLCSRFLKPPHSIRHGRLFQATERGFDAIVAVYAWTLRQTLRFRPVAMIVSLLLVGGTVYLFQKVPMGFIPSQDMNQLQAQIEGQQGVGFQVMTAKYAEAERIMTEDPNVAAVAGMIPSGNQARMFLQLKPREERPLSADQVIEALRPKLARIPGVRIIVANQPPIRLGSQNTRSLYQYTLQDPDTAELYATAPMLEAAMRDLPGLTDVTSDLQIRSPQIDVTFDRDRIAAAGLTVDQVESALSNAYGTRQVTTILAPQNQYQVIMQVAPQFQSNTAALSMLYLRGGNGQLVPMSSVAEVKPSVGPLQVNHVGQLPSVTISFNLRPDYALGDAVAAVEQVARETLPATVVGSFQGTAQAFQSSTKGLGLILIMAIFVIYVVLGILYESFIHPLTILSGLPAAGFGALLTLMFFKSDLNLYAFVGVIMLVGLVKKNGIMMVDFAIEARRTEGKSAVDAIYEACLVRFRPIMMTTMAALAGTLPIALGIGAGAEARRPLGLAVVGGLVVSQTLTLYLTPVFYTYMETLSGWLARERPREVKFEHPQEAVGATAPSRTAH
jgi:hydrophobic/amphiphilic exporter-1 (mainly G- bacteria), HAE1 family